MILVFRFCVMFAHNAHSHTQTKVLIQKYGETTNSINAADARFWDVSECILAMMRKQKNDHSRKDHGQ